VKISFVEPHLKLYGGIRRIIELSNRLTVRGHDVTIFHSDGSPCQWMKCIAKIKSYEALLNEEHDVIIYNDPNPVDYNLVKKAKSKLKVFYVLELYKKELLAGFNLKIYLPENKRMLFLKKSLCSPYLLLSNATWEKEWLKKNMNIDSTLLLGGVNSEMFYPIEVEKNQDEIRILCSGDPRERKGTKNILEAIEIVKKEEPRIVLDTYYGKGIPQEKMAEKYCSADIFVEASWQAGWNNPVAEAMACKIPVVCTDIGGVKDFAFHEKTALLVPPENSQAMATAILRLIGDKNLGKELGEYAYQHIKKFNWDESVKRLEEILNSSLNMHNLSFSKVWLIIVNWFFECIFKILKNCYKIIQIMLKKLNNFIYYIFLNKRQLKSISIERLPVFEKERFHTRKLQQSICDSFNYILGNKTFNQCLDAGCGGNQYRKFLMEKCKKVIGVDINPLVSPNTYKMDLLNLEYEDNIFDLIFCNQTIEHINPKKHMKLFSELIRVCKPHGNILIFTPNQFGPTRLFEGNFMRYLDADHKKEFNYFYAKEIKNLVESKYNCRIKIYGYSSYDSDHQQLIRLWTWLPKYFKKIPIVYPLFGRGFCFYIEKI